MNDFRMQYIGAVALLCRMHSCIPETARNHVDAAEQWPLDRVAKDFNGFGFSVEMVPNGSTWTLAERKEVPE